jgi:hypothetical protein
MRVKIAATISALRLRLNFPGEAELDRLPVALPPFLWLDIVDELSVEVSLLSVLHTRACPALDTREVEEYEPCVSMRCASLWQTNQQGLVQLARKQSKSVIKINYIYIS